MIIGLANDHAGYELKNEIKEFLTKDVSTEIIDFGCYSNESCDYPDFAHKLAIAIEEKKCDFGVAICGSGNGINMTLNKHQQIRSALCWNSEIAELARKHNDANICVLPARFINMETAKNVVRNFLTTDFEGGRHLNRIKKIPC